MDICPGHGVMWRLPEKGHRSQILVTWITKVSPQRARKGEVINDELKRHWARSKKVEQQEGKTCNQRVIRARCWVCAFPSAFVALMLALPVVSWVYVAFL